MKNLAELLIQRNIKFAYSGESNIMYIEGKLATLDAFNPGKFSLHSNGVTIGNLTSVDVIHTIEYDKEIEDIMSSVPNMQRRDSQIYHEFKGGRN